jgi:hypothetical protein
MIRIINFGVLKIYLFIQQLHNYIGDNVNKLNEVHEYICYFKFSEPTQIIYGELLRDVESKAPMTFNSLEEAESYASEYLQKRFHFRK